jgi:hypothetical protein
MNSLKVDMGIAKFPYLCINTTKYLCVWEKTKKVNRVALWLWLES